MARFAIDKARTRNRLEPRREPYWGAPLARGLFLGFRVLEDGGGTWIARQRDDDGRQHYHSLGHIGSTSYEQAVEAARGWAKVLGAGVNTTEVQTVAEACKAYVKDRRREVGDDNADDAEGRFSRTVYGHAIAKVKLAKLRTEQVKEWRAGLDMADASKNRTLSALKAALNFAVSCRYVDAGRAVEWTSVKPVSVTTRRDLYLNREQRRELVDNLPAGAQPFVRALCLLPLRPGALAAATVADFSPRQATLRVTTDKAAAGRVVALAPDAVDLFRQQAKGKLPAAPLIAYDDGSPWHKERWKQPIKKAAKAAKLPAGVCAYTLRHSTITDLLTGKKDAEGKTIVPGLDALTVALIAGTSLVMIQKHYGHLLEEHAAQAMAGLAL